VGANDAHANDAQGLTVVSKPADDDVASAEAERATGVSMRLDVYLERRRSWFWRLAAMFTVRRLR